MDPLDLAVLLLRLALLLVLYAFLAAVVRAARGMLETEAVEANDRPAAKRASTGIGRRPIAPSAGQGALELTLMDAGDSDVTPGTVLTVADGATIGRGQAAGVTLVEPTVSTVHARLERRDGAWFVVDLQSTNGTTVNGHLVPSGMSVRLPAGASLRLGNVELRVEAESR